MNSACVTTSMTKESPDMGLNKHVAERKHFRFLDLDFKWFERFVSVKFIRLLILFLGLVLASCNIP